MIRELEHYERLALNVMYDYTDPAYLNDSFVHAAVIGYAALRISR